jgi:hypothetical protein
MSYNLSSVPKLQFFDNDGNPLVGGKLYTYAAGTTTPLATYTDSTGATPNTNPVILDSRGEANVWLAAQSYKFVLKTSTDSTIWTVDNVSNAINVSQILANSGTAGAPPYSFSADTDTGVYLAAVGQLGLTAGGVPFLRGTDAAVTIGQSGVTDITTTMFGDLGINTALGPDRTFHARTKSAVTSSPVTVGRFEFDSTGTPANGVGAGIEFAARTGVGTYVAGAYIDAPATSVTAAAETFDLAFGTTNAGASAYKVWIKGDGKVGVGTSSPVALLDVAGTSSLNGAVTINEAGADADTRIEGDTDDNLVFVDASTDRVGIGTTTGPSRKLHVQQTSATTNAVTQVLRIDSQSSGTPANGIGVGMEFAVETAALNTEIGATIEAVTTDVTAGSEDFDLSFKTMAAGAAAAERFRATSTGLFQFNSGYGSVATAFGCRAWINFDGTLVTNPASMTGVRGSGNVSSVLDNGIGNYTINFTTAMPDTNYAAQASANFISGYDPSVVFFACEYARTTSSISFYTGYVSGTAAFSYRSNLDITIVSVSIFR